MFGLTVFKTYFWHWNFNTPIYIVNGMYDIKFWIVAECIIGSFGTLNMLCFISPLKYLSCDWEYTNGLHFVFFIGGSKGAPTRVPNLSFWHTNIFKHRHVEGCTLLWGWRAPYREILDPPLFLAFSSFSTDLLILVSSWIATYLQTVIYSGLQ